MDQNCYQQASCDTPAQTPKCTGKYTLIKRYLFKKYKTKSKQRGNLYEKETKDARCHKTTNIFYTRVLKLTLTQHYNNCHNAIIIKSYFFICSLSLRENRPLNPILFLFKKKKAFICFLNQ